MSGSLSYPTIAEAQKAVSTASVVIQAYCSSILRQNDVELDLMPSLPEEQETARKHAEQWFSSVLPGMISTNSDMMAFANKFNSFYDTLKSLADEVNDPQKKEELVQALTILRNSVSKTHTQARKVELSLKDFHHSLNADYTTFQKSSSKAVAAYEGKNGEISEISGQIDSVQEKMHKLLGVMAGGGVTIVGGTIVIFVGAFAEIETASISTGLIVSGIGMTIAGTSTEIGGGVEYGLAVHQLEQLKEKLAKDKQGLVAVKLVKGYLDGLVHQLSEVTTATHSLVNSWSELDDSMQKLINDLEKNPDGLNLKSILSVAKTDWENALSLAEQLQLSVGDLEIEQVSHIQDVIQANSN